MPKHFILHVHVSKPAEEDIQGKPWYPTHLRSSIAYVNLKTFNLWPQDYAVFYITKTTSVIYKMNINYRNDALNGRNIWRRLILLHIFDVFNQITNKVQTF